MSNKDVRDSARTYFIPFLLGNNRLSHKLGAKILIKYSVSSLVLGKKRCVCDAFDPSTRFARLSQTDEPEILALELISIAKQYPYSLPILIPCSAEYAELVQTQRHNLEPFFVLCDAENVFSSSPLANIP